MSKQSYHTPHRNVKSFTKLNQAVLKSGAWLVYRVWLLARSADDGKGWVTTEDLLARMEEAGLSRTHLWHAKHDENFNRFFIDISRGRYFLHSLKAVCRSFATFPGEVVQVEEKDLSKAGNFKAALFATHFVDEHIATVGQLADRYDVGESTVRRWIKRAKLTKTANFVTADPDMEDLPVPESQIDKRGDGWHWVEEINGQEKIVWQTGNSYRNSRAKRLPRGMTIRVARALRNAVFLDDGQYRKTFYEKSDSLVGARGDVAVKAGKIDQHGKRGRVWELLRLAA